MGNVLYAKCGCGLEKENLLEGALMSGDSFRIYGCSDCGTVSSVKSNDESTYLCGKCQNQMTRINYYNDDFYPCPKCKRNELRLMTVLMAD